MDRRNKTVGNILDVPKNKDGIKGRIIRERLVIHFKIVMISSSLKNAAIQIVSGGCIYSYYACQAAVCIITAHASERSVLL
jgi:hypothetical protein